MATETASQLQLGDIVRLKSGGPHMTVSMIEDKPEFKSPKIECAYFDENNSPQKVVCPEACLNKL